MDMNEFTQVIEAVTKLFEKKVSKEIREIVEKNTVKQSMYESEKIAELAKAFSKAQSEYNFVNYNRKNPHWQSQYADLHAILKGVRPALAANGLSFYQYTRISDGNGPTMLHTRILHSSGQWIETRSRLIPPKNDQQTYGSTLTYQKRYSAMTVLGVTASNDMTDDDAEIAMEGPRGITNKGPNTNYNPREQSFDPITKEQLEEMNYELAEYPDIAENILEVMHLQTLSDLPKSKYRAAMEQIRKIKRLRNEGE